MLKGVAPSSGGDLPRDRHAIVVALSNLSETLTSAESDTAFAAAAQTAGALLRVPRVIILVDSTGGGLRVGGVFGGPVDEDLADAAKEVAQEALAASAPLVVANTAAGSSSGSKKLDNCGIASAICVPMRVGQASVGAILGLSDVLRAFSPGDIELLHVVASYAALAAVRTSPASESSEALIARCDDLIRLADRKIQELSLLNQVSDAMSSTLDLDTLLDIALEQSLAAVGADAGSLMLVGEETGRLEIVAARGLPQELIESTSQEIGKSIAGWVAEHGESVLVTDAHKDERFDMPFFRDSITSSASVPLKSKNQIIGVLNVNTVRSSRQFDERDLELLQTIANQMAVAIENARLYARVRRRTQQLGSLLEISKTVTASLDLEDRLRKLGNEICKVFELDVCVIMLVDELSGRLRFGSGSGLKTRHKYAYYDLAAPVAWRVVETDRRLLVRDVNSSPHLASEISRREGFRSAIGLPLRNHSKLVAVAVGFSREQRQFAPSHRAIMKPLSELAGVAVHNARAYQRTYRIASMLQQKLVPSNIPQIEGLDIGHKYLPAREVGGDYYDFICVGPRCVAVVLSDVAGSDVEAAEHTTMGKHVLRAYAKECASPARVLAKTNDLICESTAAEVFISTFYGVVDLDQMKMRYANAGCEPAILYRASTRDTQTLKAEGILLGVKAGLHYEECEVSLEPGDVLVAFTDGLTEAAQQGMRLGTESVTQIIRHCARLKAQKIADRIYDRLIEFTRGRVSDDVAMVVLKVL
ncbi:MAG: SpoIIE family protein phosphatase [Armatimonadota bacterium]